MPAIVDASSCDIAVVGAGAAGLAAAIFTRRLNPSRRVLLLDGAARPGAKILVSGGSRCNVTNIVVTERDFAGGKPPIIRRVLRAFTPAETAAWLHVECALSFGPGLIAEDLPEQLPKVFRALGM